MAGTLALSAASWNERYMRAVERLNDAGGILRVRDTLRGAFAGGAAVAYLEPACEMTSRLHVGVFTGSFNPLTWAHVAVAETARQVLHLDALVWACSRVTVDKEAVERATLLDRVEQVDVLVRAERHADVVAVVDAGLYVEQARAFRATLRPDVRLTLIVGYDKIMQILDPRYYDDRDARLAELFALADLSVAPRAEADEHALADLLSEPSNGRFAGSIHFLPVPPRVAVLSSTRAREQARHCDAASATRLASIVPPEGAALACALGAYRMPTKSGETGGAGAAGDAYVWRQLWVESLRTGDVTRGVRMDLGLLVARTLERSERGEQTRRWLTGERRADAPASAGELARDLLR